MKKNSNKTLDVLYQSDDNYAMVSGISIASLLSNNKHLKVNIYYCGYKLVPDNIKKLKSLINEFNNATITFIDGEKYHSKLRELGVRPWHGVYVTWLKLLAFGDLKLESDRVVFINGHTIINGALDYFIDFDFSGKSMALAYDCLINDHKAVIGLKPTDGYYNCGIMLINHSKWTNEHLSDKIIEHLKAKSDYQIADQDLCNVMFKNDIALLDCAYNFSSAYYAYNVKTLLKINNLRPNYFYSYDDIMSNYYSPKIIHSLFGIKGKPWEIGNEHPQRLLWDKYLKITPWKDAKRKNAVRTMTWRLYDTLPSNTFMTLYGINVKEKFGKTPKRSH